MKHLREAEDPTTETGNIIHMCEEKFREPDGRLDTARWIQKHWQLRDHQDAELAKVDEPCKLTDHMMEL